VHTAFPVRVDSRMTLSTVNEAVRFLFAVSNLVNNNHTDKYEIAMSINMNGV